ncbi:Hypothetical predicted protein, partial [Paramuricea clavata]
YTDNIPCPCGWKKILNSCYLFVKNKVTWDTAREDCLQRGGDLVIPTSTTECVLLSQRASILQMSIPWIGLFRRYDGKFYNTCGKTPNFTRWYPNQPDNYGNREKCGHMLVNGKYKAKWNDMACNAKYSYICEFKQPRCEYLAKILRCGASSMVRRHPSLETSKLLLSV